MKYDKNQLKSSIIGLKMHRNVVKIKITDEKLK